MQQAIMQRNQLFNTYVQEKNSTGLATLYTTDATLFPPKLPAVTGNTAIGDFFAAVFQQGISSGTFASQHITITADIAVESGRYELFATPDHCVATGHYVYVWKNINDNWYIRQDIWND
ncbi:YybH family protein [Chitinophaga nivalis]|uniref:Nuclear transport factor 2 family protein n=1 Tax=Chitinophaga nivalis TaxID=2991709 RepID=A0ABT3IKM9_9BACT|nr:nuclear transport factor 2 family protein [Chitinophaga nivalis]MCW3465805.1 nuclear transport factor 2 family protein [Chitinophaga nivalis]MCW3484504.1 nuclear transport factor 2 family protein [Chitinophaga nivalis]